MAEKLKERVKEIVGTGEREPGYEYGGILPFRKNKETGEIDWALRNSDAFNAIAEALLAPGKALKGEEIPPEVALELAMTVMGGGVGASAMKGGAGAGELGINLYHGGRQWRPEPPNYPVGRFDLRKRETGTGMQAWGAGAYNSDSLPYADKYREMASKTWRISPEEARDLFTPGREIKTGEPYNYIVQETPPELLADNTVLIRYKDAKTGKIAEGGSVLMPFSRLSAHEYELTTGRPTAALYELDIPDSLLGNVPRAEEAWQKSTKSVRDAIADLLLRPEISDFTRKFGGRDSANLHSVYTSAVGDIAEHAGISRSDAAWDVSNFLRERGIPGQKYQDWLEDDPVMNYVLWDQEVLDAAKYKRVK